MAQVRSGTFIDSGKNPPPTRTRTAPDGEVIVEKLPATVHRTYLDKAGNVRPWSLASGLNDRNPNAEYGLDVDMRLRAVGIVPYFKCPMADAELVRHVPKDLQTNPCMPKAFGAGVGEYGTPCKHIAEMEKRRKELNTAKALEAEERARSIEQRALEMQIEERDDRHAEQKRGNDLRERELELKERELAVRELEAKAVAKDNGKRK